MKSCSHGFRDLSSRNEVNQRSYKPNHPRSFRNTMMMMMVVMRMMKMMMVVVI